MRTIALALLSLALTGPAHAWGELGHRTVAEIAARHLSERAAAGVGELLGGDVRKLVDIATWADEYREEGHPETYDWHLVYMPLDAVRYDRARHCRGEACIVEKIPQFAGVLHDRAAGTEARVEALRFLVHLIGDIHTPVHALAPLNRPRGSWIRIGDMVDSLHLWWDNRFVDALAEDERALADDLRDRFAAEPGANPPQGTPEDWINESFVIARDFVLSHALHARLKAGDGPPERPIELDEATYDDVAPIVRARLFAAGLRLARLLNEALD